MPGVSQQISPSFLASQLAPCAKLFAFHFSFNLETLEQLLFVWNAHPGWVALLAWVSSRAGSSLWTVSAPRQL